MKTGTSGQVHVEDGEKRRENREVFATREKTELRKRVRKGHRSYEIINGFECE